ncbi:uncharacterized protein PgNI_00036 [Pyricularia grisea]|uniref:Heterokaryon incompatibility domain-containing protein n=1 Tax=Pyricularia grisea TaxID=148305 RepID=A0A6P8BGT4_PYRGI|nr:uncharacterized protein PgNI_00036 [Pyricularia grisea]TLD16076.1 hypothetical protein PgNI_00036 [Pyricularia grisea]
MHAAITTNSLRHDTIKEAQVFDEIMVQVGPFNDQNEDVAEWSMPQLRLTLESLKRATLVLAGSNLTPTSGRRRTIVSLVIGYQTATCLAEKLHELPIKVINVGDSLHSTTVSLFISQGLNANYVALSHCWIAILPTKFRDVVTMTCNLVIRYLWIDSLCIQQDSKSDWDSESKMVGSVYRNSIEAIPARVSSGSKEGVLKGDTSIAKRHKRISLTLSSQGKGGCTGSTEVTVYRRDPTEEIFRALDIGCALTWRGWTLQEYMQSPRHILYGKDMLDWRCSWTFLSSNGLPPGNGTPGEAIR